LHPSIHVTTGVPVSLHERSRQLKETVASDSAATVFGALTPVTGAPSNVVMFVASGHLTRIASGVPSKPVGTAGVVQVKAWAIVGTVQPGSGRRFALGAETLPQTKESPIVTMGLGVPSAHPAPVT
jgi:hypothetical protein